MITNNFNQFKWTFDASVTHSMTRPLVLDHISGGSGRYSFPLHYFHDVICSVTVWDESGGYWWVEGGIGDQAAGHGTSDYEYDALVRRMGIEDRVWNTTYEGFCKDVQGLI